MWIPHEVDSERMNQNVRDIGRGMVEAIAHIIEQYPEDVVITINQIMQLIHENFIRCDRCGRVWLRECAIEGEQEERLGSESIYTEEPIACHAIKVKKYSYTPKYCKHCVAEGPERIRRAI